MVKIPAKPTHPEPPSLDSRDSLMDSKMAAAYLGVSAWTLVDFRYKQVGPDWIKVGKSVRYRRSALECWIESCTKKGK